jgi:phosphoribosylformylglycinamidine synthase
MTIAELNDTDETTLEHAREVGLSDDEWRHANDILGRTPNKVELGCFSAMWSEHCSYKSSRVHLRKLPTEGEHVVVGPGENAGVIDIGDGWGVCFKVESHNHPSYIEPYQGAATGVGGILRDVFTMGARPVAAMNLLRFGRPDHDKTPHLLGGVVKGIGDYGNCFGVPTVSSDVDFDASYDGNILVNAFALGVVRNDGIFKGIAEGVGNPVLYVGAKTGRDGIHGATMASDSFSEEEEAARPTVQVGDPFKEKLLLEACMEAFGADVLVGIQDMGAAGLTSSSFEMASRAGSGLLLDLDRIPARERAMTAYELMLSESQERMLLVAKKGEEETLRKIYARWELDCVPVGEVTGDGRVRLRFGGEIVGDMPARELADEAPRYERPWERPAPAPSSEDSEGIESMPLPALLERVAAAPGLASRDWVYRQYDREVLVGTLADARRAAAAVIDVKEADKRIALWMGCDGWRCAATPREGASRVVAAGALAVACAGARPLGASDCLNYGNPERPDVMWQIAEGIEGMAEACRALDVPIVSGNVSLYNETDGRSIHPTPTVAVVGAFEDSGAWTGLVPQAGDALVVVGGLPTSWRRDSVLSRPRAAAADGEVSHWSLDVVGHLVDGLLKAHRAGLPRAAVPLGAGGLAHALLRFGAHSGVGAELFLDTDARAALLGEDVPAVLVAVPAGDGAALREFFHESVEMVSIGIAKGDSLRVHRAEEVVADVPLAHLLELWRAPVNEIAGKDIS